MSSDLATLRKGKRAMARALARIEREASTVETAALLDAAWGAQTGQALGLTGPPGVGKSTLADRIIQLWRRDGLRVGVIAVDPSSAATGGALLGDRTRLVLDPDDDDLFVRSLAARGALGGLSELVLPALVLMRAAYDRVLIESVGVGQSETEIASVADTVLMCVQPGSGDALQFMKAGIMEVPHIAAVTKSDLGAIASRAAADLKGALGLSAGPEPGWETQILTVSATTGNGIGELIAACDRRAAWLQEDGRLMRRRSAQVLRWQEMAIAARFGSKGLTISRAALHKGKNESPFSAVRGIFGRISVDFSQPS